MNRCDKYENAPALLQGRGAYGYCFDRQSDMKIIPHISPSKSSPPDSVISHMDLFSVHAIQYQSAIRVNSGRWRLEDSAWSRQEPKLDRDEWLRRAYRKRVQGIFGCSGFSLLRIHHRALLVLILQIVSFNLTAGR